MANGDYTKYQSRKWRLVLLVLLAIILGTFVPPLISAWVFEAEPLIILTGGHFVTLVTLIVSAYFGANIWQKKILADTPIQLSAKAELKVGETEEDKKGDDKEA